MSELSEKQQKNLDKDIKMKDKKKNNSQLLRKIFQLVTVFLFVGFSITMGIAFFVAPKSGYSEIEKRKLTEFPKFNIKELSSGDFTDNLTKYVSDNFAFRDNFVDLGFKLEDKRGIRMDGVKIYSSENNTDYLQEQKNIKTIDTYLSSIKPLKEILPSAKPGETIPIHLTLDSIVANADLYKNLDADDIMGEQRGALFMVKNTALEIFYGTSAIAMDYCNVINAYKQAVGNDITVYNLIIPTHFEFGLPKKYKEKTGKPQKPVIDDVYKNLDPSIIKVDAYSKIEKHYKSGEYLYFNSDHHWTSLGAYRAYGAFANSAGFKPTPLKDFEKKTIDKFLGTFYTSTYDKKLEENPDRVDYYIPKCNYEVTNYRTNGVDTYKGTLLYEAVSGISSGYLVFMGGDIPLSVIKTDNNTGRSILVFKESYGNAFVPFLVSNYDTVYVADIRTFPFNAVTYAKQNNIKEVLFLNNTMTACTPPRIQNLINLLQK